MLRGRRAMRRIALLVAVVIVLVGVVQAEGSIYYSELSSRVNYIRRIPIDGGPVVTVATTPNAFTRALAIDASSGRIYAGNDDVTYIHDLNGNPLGQIAQSTHDMNIYDSQVYLARDHLYSANLDGSGLQQVYAQPIDPGHFTGFDFDSIGRLYYSSDNTSSIYRDNLDGTAFELLHAVGTNVDMGAVEVDVLNSQLYWVQDGMIYRSDLDGNGAMSLGISNVRGSGGTGDTLELDAINGKMYWAANDGIHSGGLDGSNDQLIHASTNLRAIELGPTPDDGGQQVPEPTSLALWSGLGIMGLIAARRRRKQAA
jgi:hypothetical protein